MRTKKSGRSPGGLPSRTAGSGLLAVALVALLAAACGSQGADPGDDADPSTSTSTSTSPPGGAPGRVETVEAGPGGGSGELAVRWRAAPVATGYRVSRAPAANGPFSVAADLIVATGTSTKVPGVTNVYADGQGGFVYIEVLTTPGTTRSYYRVAAYNQAGEGAPSAVVCAALVGSTC